MDPAGAGRARGFRAPTPAEEAEELEARATIADASATDTLDSSPPPRAPRTASWR